MQIHELTAPVALAEGFRDTLKNLTSPQAAQAAATQKTLANATNDYVTKLSAEWKTAVKSMPRPEPRTTPIGAKPAAQPTTQPAAQAAAQPVAQATAKPTFGQPAPYKVGAAPSAGAPTPAEQERFQQAISQALKKKGSGTMHEAFGDLPGGGTLPAGQPVRAAVTKTPPTVKGQSGVWSPTYAKYFQQWSDEKLASRIPNTNTTITMDQVRQDPGTAKQLEAALAAVVKSRDDATANDAAVNQYLSLAVRAMQKKSAEMKTQDPTLARASGGTAAVPVDPNKLQSTLNSMGIGNADLENIGKVVKDMTGGASVRRTNNAAMDSILKMMGLVS